MGNSLYAIIVNNTHALPAEYKCLKNVARTIHLRMFAGFLFNNDLRRHKFWLHRRFFFCPIPETKK